MNTKLLMSLSSFFMFAMGLAFSFMPEEILKLSGENGGPVTVLIMQLIGALYLGFAMLNYMAKGNLIGGIYSRPIAIGNFTHFLVAGLALYKGSSAFVDTTYLAPVVVIYVAFTIAFGLVTFMHPAAVKTQL
jgi:hypothetical protein